MAARRPALDEVGRHVSGGAGAILQRRGIVVERDDLLEARHDVVERRHDRGAAVRRNVLGDAAGNDPVHHQPVTERPVGRRQHALAENAAMGVDQCERRVVADRADIAEMIGDAFELRHDAAQHGGARRDVDAERRLDGAREREAERDGRIPRHPRHDARRPGEVDAGQEAVDALVHVAEPLLEPRHRLAIGREAEMAGLDDPGMHRADRNLMQAVAVHRQEFVVDRIAPRRRRARAERRAQSPLAVIEPGAVVGRVRRPVAVKVADGPFEPDRRQMEPADGRKAPLRHRRAKSRRDRRAASAAPCRPRRRRPTARADLLRRRRATWRSRSMSAHRRRSAATARETPTGASRCQDRGDCGRVHRRHPSSAATPRNHCTTGSGSQSPAMSTSVRCTKAGM